MTPPPPAVVPELDVSDLPTSLAFYVGEVGFVVAYERTEEGFAYLTLGDAHLMLETAEGEGRRFRTAPLERPFGRGINLQIRVEGVADLYDRLAARGRALLVPLEERWYARGDAEIGHRQFVVADPDGYLLRVFEPLGVRGVG